MSTSYLPLRWESTGDQWWYASPIDWAAASGHYDLVRQLIKLDPNNLIKLTSLRRIRRLETVWDDEEQFLDVAMCRSLIARELFSECETKTGKNTLFGSGYGGWVLYTAASAGDLKFIQEILQKDPLIVFGEGEYGVSDMLYAGARSKNCDVFRLIYDYASSPRFSASDDIDIPRAYTREMMNRAVHAASRGGNLVILKELMSGFEKDVLGFRDVHGSTILHAAASKGRVEVVKDLISCFDIIHSTDNNGNTALHVAAHRGHLSVVEALITASPPSIHQTNNLGETFLHMVLSGFQNPTFHRLDRQIELMKQLIRGKPLEIESIINEKKNNGRTALHVAIIENIHSDLVELLMSVGSINVNIRDCNHMTPLDLLKQRPRCDSSDVLTRHLISAGGIFSISQDYNARKTIASHLRMRSIGSPGTSFSISDTEIFTSLEKENTIRNDLSIGTCQSSSTKSKKPRSISYVKRLLRWPKAKEKGKEMDLESDRKGTPIPLRQKFSKPSCVSNNKRTLSVRSNLPSPTAKKRLAFGSVDDVTQAIPQLVNQRRSRSSSFSKTSSISSPISLDKQKGVYIETDIAGPSSEYRTPNLEREKGSINKSLMNQYLCYPFVKDPNKRAELDKDYKDYALSVA